MTTDSKNPREIFLAAVKLSPEQWDAYLSEACGSDVELRRRVQGLLQSHAELGSFLDVPAPGVGVTAEQRLAEGPGTVIGPYKLLQQLGEGGMGVVYMAEQQEPVRRLVALKIIKPGMDSGQVIARFEAERQTLALMDHPNIAKIHDAGTTQSGRPYFVMELVKGIPITKFCDENQLTARERLELFVPVSQAVQHAHTKGIIHRDLKPSNVLVALYDDKPVPKVIDFGVAKATGEKLTDRTMFTGFGAFVGTLEYMSPEQAKLNALDIDARSDVYTLGVLLYELLTGSTPLEKDRLKQSALDELLRVIREEEPAKPSTRLTTSSEAVALSAQRHSEPGKLGKALRGDLDWIVMKALEKDRTRRYETASGMARDIERYLNDEPVEACPPSAWYRFRKMARRNKAAMMTVALVAATLVFGIVGTTVGLVRAVDAEAEAIAARDQETEQRLMAEGQRKLAREQAKIAEDERRRADLLRQEALDNETKAEWRLYHSHFVAAERELERNNFGSFYAFLEKCRPDFRGWEHDYLYTLANQYQQSLRSHTGSVQSVAFSPNGLRLATLAGEEVKLWDVVGRQEVLSFKTNFPTRSNSPTPAQITFSPDGKHLVSWGVVGIAFWDVLSGQRTMTLKPSGTTKSSPIISVAFSPDGKRLASCSQGGELTLWDMASGKEPHVIQGPMTSAYLVAFSPDSKHLATSNRRDNRKVPSDVKLWDVASSKEARTFLGLGVSLSSLAISPDGKRLAGASNNTVELMDAVSGQTIITLKGHSDEVKAVAFSPDGRYLASGAGDETVKLWDVASGQLILNLRGHTSQVLGVAFSPDGKRLASASNDKTVKLWAIAKPPESMTIIPLKGQRGKVAFSPDSRRLASPTQGNLIRLWDTASGQELITLLGHTQTVISVAFSPDGKRLASTAQDKTIKLWDTTSGEALKTFVENEYGIMSVTFSADAKRLAFVSGRGGKGDTGNTVKVMDAANGQKLLTLSGHVAQVRVVVFSPDGKRLATASTDKTVRVWDTADGTQVLTLGGDMNLNGRYHEPAVVAFSPDGSRLAGALAHNAVTVWDAANGQAILTLKGHKKKVLGLAFTPDGKRLASVSEDNTVKLWNLASGQEVLTLKGPPDYVGQSLAFSPDGRSLASAGGREDPTSGNTPGQPKSTGITIKMGHEKLVIWDASKSMKELEQK